MKKTVTLVLACIAFTLASCAQAPKRGASKLYLRTQFHYSPYGSSLDISWIYTGADGIIVNNPKHGVDPINIAEESADNAANTGTYKKVGDQLHISWKNGKTESWKMEYDKSGVISAIDGGIVTEQPPLPANYRLSGQYAAGAVLPNVSSVSTLIFKKDGTFTRENSGAVSTGSASGYSSNSSGGTYTITGNTLKLNFANGEKVVAVITVWDMEGSGKKRLIINGSSFPQEG